MGTGERSGDDAWRRGTAVALRLIAAGHETWFAGGCVRDRLLGIACDDVDVATAAPPEAVEALFPRTVPVGKAFGIIVVVDDDGGHTEVATFRADGVYLDGRRPEGVRFATSAEDVERRDFTVNALLMDPRDGSVRDLVGGVADLRAGILRAVGDAAARLAEDRLRVLRALRFAARYGFSIEPDTAAALRSAGLHGLSRERIWQEFAKATGKPGAERYPALVRTHLDADPFWGGGHCAPMVAEPAAPLAVRLAAWGWDRPWPAALEREPLPRADLQLARWLHGLRADPGDTVAWRRVARDPRHGAAGAVLATVDTDRSAALADAVAWLDARPFATLMGADLTALGIPPGPAIGTLLRRLEEHQLVHGGVDPIDARMMVQGWNQAPAR
ncbi:MAG: hypothetical protein RLZZ127_1098 [Planctomycetota bacterium]|jgi:poly(A) polymerase